MNELETKSQVDRNDPPSKYTATMAPKPPAPPLLPTARRSGCGCFKILVIFIFAFGIWFYLKGCQ